MFEKEIKFIIIFIIIYIIYSMFITPKESFTVSICDDIPTDLTSNDYAVSNYKICRLQNLASLINDNSDNSIRLTSTVDGDHATMYEIFNEIPSYNMQYDNRTINSRWITRKIKFYNDTNDDNRIRKRTEIKRIIRELRDSARAIQPDWISGLVNGANISIIPKKGCTAVNITGTGINYNDIPRADKNCAESIKWSGYIKIPQNKSCVFTIEVPNPFTLIINDEEQTMYGANHDIGTRQTTAFISSNTFRDNYISYEFAINNYEDEFTMDTFNEVSFLWQLDDGENTQIPNANFYV